MRRSGFIPVIVAFAFIGTAGSSLGAQKGAAVTDDGYSGKVLEKILASGKAEFGQPVEIALFLDEDGKVADCRKVRGGDAKSVCAAARSSAPYGQPPYGVPAKIFISFWNEGVKAASRDAPTHPTAQQPAAATDAKYLAKIQREIRDAIYIPRETPKGTYDAEIRISVAKDGKIEKSSILQSSGDARLDKYISQGIARAGKVTPPPAGLKNPLALKLKFIRN